MWGKHICFFCLFVFPVKKVQRLYAKSCNIPVKKVSYSYTMIYRSLEKGSEEWITIQLRNNFQKSWRSYHQVPEANILFQKQHPHTRFQKQLLKKPQKMPGKMRDRKQNLKITGHLPDDLQKWHFTTDSIQKASKVSERPSHRTHLGTCHSCFSVQLIWPRNTLFQLQVPRDFSLKRLHLHF